MSVVSLEAARAAREQSRAAAAATRLVATMELAFGWSDHALAHGLPAERRYELARKARALIRHDRVLTGRPIGSSLR